MEWGEHADTLEKYREKGMDVPALEREPVLFEDLFEVWNIFQYVNGSRQMGMSACPLLVSEIESCLDFYSIQDSETRLEYFELIKQMDATWMAWFAKKQESKSGNRRISKTIN